MSIYEIYWINKYNPIHNKQDSYDGHNSKLNLSELFPSKIINIDDLINFNFDLSMFDDMIKNKKIELYEDEFTGKELTESSKSEFLNVQYNLFNLLKFTSEIKSNYKLSYKDYMISNT